MEVLKKIAVQTLKSWADLNLAPGYLYQTIERGAPHLYSKNLAGQLFNGCQVDCDIRETIQQLIYFFGYYEAIETFWVTQVLKPGDVMIDAGANLGYFSLIGAHVVGDSGQVHSFEPIPDNFKRLEKNIGMNQFDKIVRINNQGVWDQKEVLHFGLSHQTANNFGTFSAGSKENLAHQFDCPVVCLDDYVQEQKLDRLDFIKMDVEGAEWKALLGAEKTLKKFKPHLLIEICKYTCDRFGYDQNVIWELLKPMGYKMHLIGQSSQTSRPLESLDGILQDNVLFYQDELPVTLQESWDLKSLRKSFF